LAIEELKVIEKLLCFHASNVKIIADEGVVWLFAGNDHIWQFPFQQQEAAC
jgi:hypothetical protein